MQPKPKTNRSIYGISGSGLLRLLSYSSLDSAIAKDWVHWIEKIRLAPQGRKGIESNTYTGFLWKALKAHDFLRISSQ